MALFDLKAALFGVASIAAIGGVSYYAVYSRDTPPAIASGASTTTPPGDASQAPAQAAAVPDFVIPARFTVRLKRGYQEGYAIGVSEGTPAIKAEDQVCDFSVNADHSCELVVPYVDGQDGYLTKIRLAPHAGRPDRFVITRNNERTDNLTWDALKAGVKLEHALTVQVLEKVPS